MMHCPRASNRRGAAGRCDKAVEVATTKGLLANAGGHMKLLEKPAGGDRRSDDVVLPAAARSRSRPAQDQLSTFISTGWTRVGPGLGFSHCLPVVLFDQAIDARTPIFFAVRDPVRQGVAHGRRPISLDEPRETYTVWRTSAPPSAVNRTAAARRGRGPGCAAGGARK